MIREALSITLAVPLMACTGSLAARIVSSTVSVIFARMPPGAARSRICSPGIR
jgi:hypothetical protein